MTGTRTHLVPEEVRAAEVGSGYGRLRLRLRSWTGERRWVGHTGYSPPVAENVVAGEGIGCSRGAGEGDHHHHHHHRMTDNLAEVEVEAGIRRHILPDSRRRRRCRHNALLDRTRRSLTCFGSVVVVETLMRG